jgi:hypothetical protein
MKRASSGTVHHFTEAVNTTALKDLCILCTVPDTFALHSVAYVLTL